MIALERSVGGKIQSIFSGNQRHRARLLIAGQNDIDILEIAGSPQNAAFRAIVAGQHP